RRAEEASPAGSNDDVLAAVLAHEGHRDRVRAGLERRLPELPAVLIERAKTRVVGRADEDHAARGDDAAAQAERAGVIEAFRLQLLDEAERHAPRDVSLVHVNGDELAEWRRRARNLVHRIPEAPDRAAPRRCPLPCRGTAAAAR